MVRLFQRPAAAEERVHNKRREQIPQERVMVLKEILIGNKFRIYEPRGMDMFKRITTQRRRKPGDVQAVSQTGSQMCQEEKKRKLLINGIQI